MSPERVVTIAILVAVLLILLFFGLELAGAR